MPADIVTAAIAQINCTVGDFSGNAVKIIEYAQRAKQQGADMLVTPELALSGYPPEDLLFRDSFYQATEQALADIARSVPDLILVVGHPHQVGRIHYNAASVIRGGRIVATYHKHHLPNYTVFDEERYFEPGHEPCVFELNGIKFGVNICADVWFPEAPALAKAAGAQVLLVLNASPYHMDKQEERYQVARDRARENGMAIVYANLVGGQDELVFDGGSFVMSREGAVTHQFQLLEETLALVSLHGAAPIGNAVTAPLSLEATIYRALCLGVRDYVGKNGFPGVLLGLSGGIDSALTLTIAVDALGAEKVHAVMMPSPYTAQMSLEDARTMAETLGVAYSELPIDAIFGTFAAVLADEFTGLAPDATEENIQARIRGTLLMALSNKSGAIVLTTGNKSEMAVGYCTLYGDMAGGFAVLRDISKTMVYRLSRYRNQVAPVIPQRVIARPPSAELRPDQTDQDSLPPYDLLDAIVELYMEQDRSPREIIEAGFNPDQVKKVVGLIKHNEYKRRQAPVGVRITERGFGKDWRYPITSKYQPDF